MKRTHDQNRIKHKLVQTSVLIDVKITDCFITLLDTWNHLMNSWRDMYWFYVKWSHFLAVRSTNFAHVVSKVLRLMSVVLTSRYIYNWMVLRWSYKMNEEEVSLALRNCNIHTFLTQCFLSNYLRECISLFNMENVFSPNYYVKDVLHFFMYNVLRIYTQAPEV